MRPWGGTEMCYRRRFVGAFGLAAIIVLLLVLVPSALSVDGPNQYRASIAPTSIVAGTGVTANAPTATGSYTWTTAANAAIDLSGTPFTNAGSDPAVTVTPGPLDHFDFGNIATQVAGAFFGVTVTARDQYDNLKYDYPDG